MEREQGEQRRETQDWDDSPCGVALGTPELATGVVWAEWAGEGAGVEVVALLLQADCMAWQFGALFRENSRVTR
jgi:hypothetical protein